MPSPARIQSEVQKLADLVNFEEVARHLETAEQMENAVGLVSQGKYRQGYDRLIPLIDAKRGSFSRFATDVAELALGEVLDRLFEAGYLMEARELMREWLRRVPGHPAMTCRFMESFTSLLDEMEARDNLDRQLNKAFAQSPYALQLYLVRARRIAFLRLWEPHIRLIKLVTLIWGELRRMEWLLFPTRHNVRVHLKDLFMSTYRALNTFKSQRRLREIIAQVNQMFRPDEAPILTEEQLASLDELNQTIQQPATPQEERALLKEISLETIQQLLDGAEVFEQIQKWLDNGRFHHVYHKLIPFEKWAGHPLWSAFRTQAVSALTELSMRSPSRTETVDDLLRYTEEWAALSPGDARPLLRKAMLLLQKDAPSEAISAAETARSLVPRSIEPPIITTLAMGGLPAEDSDRLRAVQSLQRAWRNLRYAQWIMVPYPEHVRGFLQLLVALTAIVVAMVGNMRQEALEILDKGGELLSRNAVELKMARRVIMNTDESR